MADSSKGFLARQMDKAKERHDELEQARQAGKIQASEARAARSEEQRQTLASAIESGAHSGTEYHVDELRETLIGGRMEGGKLKVLLNQRAAEGWTLKQVVSADVGGRVGPGGR